ncbi:hypothetical protein SAMN05216312_109154 [Cohnella sp. OV330]|uniref:HAD family hydrolase n=1 Tax=Cohnella sp. OV330 TaxID=1855288 RepID=UPI0008E610CD|nr:HAD family hydrolase [Cohnella sp. OV330]SFB47451.1 hypothetical protein SAMN05216312_109154 [Cohnella sp. OV330]
MKDVKDIIIQNNNLKYVFFDIFDTILLRSVHPEYTKMIWAKRLSNELGHGSKAKDIYELRNQIELQIGEKNEQDGWDREFQYEQFSLRLYQVLEARNSIKSLYQYEDFHRKCLDIELDVELSVQLVDPQWIELITYIKSNTFLKVYCVSDFYLSSDSIRRLFQEHGILSYIDELIVSSDHLITKRSGRLYAHVFEKYGIEPSVVLMVGDNEHSDNMVPIQKGMKSFLIDRKSERTVYDDFMREYHISKQINNKDQLFKIANQGRSQTPFHNIIFSLFYFIKKLHEELVFKRVNDVFFLSREGEYLKTLFDLYQQSEGFRYAHRINTHYLKVSRKSTFLPSLKSLKEERFLTLFRQYRMISAYEFMASLNFEEHVIQTIKHQTDFDLFQKEEDFPTSECYRWLINNPDFSNYYENNRLEQNANFKEYVRELNPNYKTDGLHIVDIGWKGTIQDHLWDIFNQEVCINGYYAGLIAEGNADSGNEKQGLLFSSIPIKSDYFGVFNENRAIFEIVLGASHGSAERYVLTEGTVVVHVNQNEKEMEIFNKIVSPMQREMLITFEELCRYFCLKSFDIEEDLAYFAEIHSQFVLHPNKKELTFFDQLYHYENFGVFEFTKFRTSDTKISTILKLRSMRRLAMNPNAFFRNSFWGPLTLKEQGLSFLIPLYAKYKRKKYFTEKTSLTSQGTALPQQKFEEKLKENALAMKNMTRMIDDRDAAISNMTRMIDDRDQAIKSMTQMIDERDEMIRQINIKLEDLMKKS